LSPLLSVSARHKNDAALPLLSISPSPRYGCRNRLLPSVSMAALLRVRHSALFWKSRPSRLGGVEQRTTAVADRFIGGLQWATSQPKTRSQTMSKPMFRPRPRPRPETKPDP
ncbi:unnamed protein product, partial [Musa textilis]